MKRAERNRSMLMAIAPKMDVLGFMKSNCQFFVLVFFLLIQPKGVLGQNNTRTLAADLQNGLVAWYPADGNANDYSGKVNNGTMTAITFTTDRFGRPNRAFNSNSGYIDCGLGLTLKDSSNFTLSIWVKTTTKGLQGCLGKSNGAILGWKLSFTDLSGTMFFGCHDGSFRGYVTAPSIADDAWHLIVAQREGTILRIFKDGVLSQETDKVTLGNTNSPNSKVYIGSGWVGQLDDARIYNRVLTAEEIGKLPADTCPPVVKPYAGRDTLNIVGTSFQLPSVSVIAGQEKSWRLAENSPSKDGRISGGVFTGTPGSNYSLVCELSNGCSYKNSDTIKVSFGNVSSVGNISKASSLQAFPNPFNQNLTVIYELTRASTIELALFDLSGRKVATIVSGKKTAGEQRAWFDGSRLKNGSYILELKTSDGVLKKHIVVRK